MTKVANIDKISLKWTIKKDNTGKCKVFKNQFKFSKIIQNCKSARKVLDQDWTKICQNRFSFGQKEEFDTLTLIQ